MKRKRVSVDAADKKSFMLGLAGFLVLLGLVGWGYFVRAVWGK